MKDKLKFRKSKAEDLKEELISRRHPERTVFNFLNGYNVWLFKHDRDFRDRVKREHNVTHIDGVVISMVHTFTTFRPVRRLKGPDFTDFVLRRGEFADRKHVFVGLNEEDVDKLVSRYPKLKKKNAYSYDLPMIDAKNFDNTELANYINKIKPDYIWVGIGSPKQEIISNDLREKINHGYILNVGAALDYAKGKKRQSPRGFQILGLEWLYRFTTDFKHSKSKAIKSLFAGVFYTPFLTRVEK